MKQRAILPWIMFACLLLSVRLDAQETGLLGYWKEPTGSILHIETCGADVCASVVSISPAAPTHIDANNPNPTLQHRSLCGLRIGEGFKPESSTRATGGSLYDPKTGKTYKGLMESHGDQLDLRGYIGFSLFGRTERWTRTSTPGACRPDAS